MFCCIENSVVDTFCHLDLKLSFFEFCTSRQLSYYHIFWNLWRLFRVGLFDLPWVQDVMLIPRHGLGNIRCLPGPSNVTGDSLFPIFILIVAAVTLLSSFVLALGCFPLGSLRSYPPYKQFKKQSGIWGACSQIPDPFLWGSLWDSPPTHTPTPHPTHTHSSCL